MARKRPVEISVATFFDDKQDSRQAFMELILQKRRTAAISTRFPVDVAPSHKYNEDMVFSDVRVDKEEKIA